MQHPGDRRVKQAEVVADHDHSPAVIAQEIHQPCLGVAVEVVGRLVEQQKVGVGEQHPRQLDAPALTAGEDAQRQVDAVQPEPEPRRDPPRVRLARIPAIEPVPLLRGGVKLDAGEGVIVLEAAMQLGKARRRAVEAPTRQDVRERRVGD